VPRQLRIDYPGAIHHVMSRGDRREDSYHADVDRQEFVKTLAEACQKADGQVHAYCLLRNHFHLVVEPPKNDPGKLRLAARLRKEPVLSVKRIAARVHLGSYPTANRNLHAWMKPAGKRKAK
jgi:REP element-mobilizing transposase RayT